jgi:hypothetical protein
MGSSNANLLERKKGTQRSTRNFDLGKLLVIESKDKRSHAIEMLIGHAESLYVKIP